MREDVSVNAINNVFKTISVNVGLTISKQNLFKCT